VEIINIYCDGGARGNPGRAAGAFIAIDGRGKLVHKDSKFLGSTTNNVAEYEAVILALGWVLGKLNEVNFENICFYLDSELITNQLNGTYKVKNLKLKELFFKVIKLQKKINKNIFYKSIPREENKSADCLVNERLDKQKSFT